MFANLFRRPVGSVVPQELYGSVVAQSRQPEFFTDFGFQDTVTGRYDVVSLHLFLFSRRLVREDTPLAQNLNQEVFDQFTDETDRALRELGVGDTSVPKRKKRMVHSFYAIVEEFSPFLDTNDTNGLSKAVETRFAVPEDKKSGEAVGAFNATALSRYVMASAENLDAIPSQDIMNGNLSWLAPANFL